MFIVVLDEFDNCYKWKPMIGAQDIITWRCSGSYDKIAKRHQTWIGIGLRSGCMETIVIGTVNVLSMQDPMGHRQIVKEAVMNCFKKNCGLIAMQ